jgi:hypothetical protein
LKELFGALNLKSALIDKQSSTAQMIRQVPLHVSGCLLGYALVITEEVAGCCAVLDLVELVDVGGEFPGRILLFDPPVVSVVPVLFYKGIVAGMTDLA